MAKTDAKTSSKLVLACKHASFSIESVDASFSRRLKLAVKLVLAVNQNSFSISGFSASFSRS